MSGFSNRLSVPKNLNNLIGTDFLERKFRKLRKLDMTYILGARCSDGVVLVGDTKVTIDEGSQFSFSKKIFKPFSSVVLGASGISGLYKSFQDRMVVAVQNYETQGLNVSQPEKLSIIAEEVIRQMHNTYLEDRHLITTNLSVLMCVRTGERAELRVFSGYGIPEPVNELKVIGHGEPYGTMFLKNMWNKNLTMEQTAKLAIFTIKAINEMEIDGSVGYNEEFLPQVYYIPDVNLPENLEEEYAEKTDEEYLQALQGIYSEYPIKELNKQEVNHLINSVGNLNAKLTEFFKSGDFKI